MSDNQKTAVIVIGLDSLQGLQAARIMHGHGVPVIAIASDKNHYACRTNTCAEIHYADTGSSELVDTLLGLNSTLSHKAVLLPCQDKSVRILSRFRDRLGASFEMALPDAESVDLLMDKHAFHDYAMKNRLRIPATYRLQSRADTLAAAKTMPFPCILKPSSRTADWDSHSRLKVIRIENGGELVSRYDECREWADTLIAQQWISGGDDSLYSCNCYFSKAGQPLVTFTARKLRQWPPGAGSSCLGEEVRDDTVLATTRKLFGDLSYRGLGYLEMKRDAASGEYFIIEPNIGRPTGRSAIAEGGGVALLYTMYCDVLNLPLPANRLQHYRKTKWVDLRHDLQSAFWYWQNGQLTLRGWLRSLRGRKTHAVFSIRDPLPFLSDLKNAAAMLFAQ